MNKEDGKEERKQIAYNKTEELNNWTCNEDWRTGEVQEKKIKNWELWKEKRN